MIRKAFLIFLIFCFKLASAQESSNFTQFYMNPYRINPSYAGVDGQGALFLTYRSQWSGIEGSPTTMNLSYHNSSKLNANFGFNVTNESVGIVNATSLLVTLGYTLPVAKEQYVRFGISAGVGMNTYDLDKLGSDALISDPELESILQNRFNVLGEVGLSYHYKFFNIGVAAPNVFADSYDSLSTFKVGSFAAINKLIIHSNYRYYFGFEDRYAIEPHVVYRLNNPLPSQYEAGLIFHMNHAFWLGGSYKQNFGISGIGGVKVNGLFALGYSFGIANTGENELNRPTHEVQVNFLFGKKKKHKHIYSFTDSKKPIVKKTRRQLLAEQHQAERERIAAEQAAAEKAAEEKAQQEREERLAAEKAAAEKAEQDRLAQEQAAKQTEEKRIAEQQREAAEKAQQEEANRLAQQQRTATEKEQQAEAERLAEQQKQRDEQARQRQATEQAQQQEAERIAQQQAEQEKERQAQAAAKLAQQKADDEEREAQEAERLAQQQADEDKLRLAQQALEQQKKEPEVVTKAHETKIDSDGNIKSAFTTDEKVSVKRGGHFLELQPGEYVVVGVFAEFEHAELYSDKLFEYGYTTRFGFISATNMWYVHLYEADDIDKARSERDKFRKLNMFKKAWVLSVE